MKCKMCMSAKSPTIKLWDGEYYCQECLEAKAPGLFNFALTHEQFVSDYSKWRSIYSPKKAFLLIGLFVFLILCASLLCLYVSPPDSLSREDGSLFWFCILVPLPCSIVFFLLLLLYYGTSLRSEIQHHPRIIIENNFVTLIHPRGKYFWRPDQKVVALHKIRIKTMPMKSDIHFPLLSLGSHLDFLMLDFTNCAEETFQGKFTNRYPYSVYRLFSPIDQMCWFKSPYLIYSFDAQTMNFLAVFFQVCVIFQGDSSVLAQPISLAPKPQVSDAISGENSEAEQVDTSPVPNTR